MPDVLEPEKLVPEDGADGHVIEEDDEDKDYKGGCFEDIRGHHRVRGFMFPDYEKSEKDKGRDEEADLVGG